MQDREITNDCVAFGFYSIDATARTLGVFYGDLVAWFDAVQCPPDKIAVQGSGFGGKPITFSRGDARLRKKKFSEVKALSLAAMLPDGVYMPLEWWATAAVDVGLGLRPYFVLAARAPVTTLDDEAVTKLITSCVYNLRPAYGIGFHRNHDQGPLYYAGGLYYGPIPADDEEDEALTICRWGDLAVVKEVYKEGILRDVYPHNYLSEPQLNARIGKKSLKDWIWSDLSRGTLTALDDRMMLWNVPTRQIPSIRKQLWSAEIIFDWKKYLDE
jgi:hypothetical protein